MGRSVSAVVVLLGICFTGFSEAQTVSLDEFVELVLANNRGIQNAERSVRDAEGELSGWLSLENTRFDVSGSLRYLPPMEEGAGGLSDPSGGQPGGESTQEGQTTLSGEVSVSVPIIPQVSVSGRLNDEGNGSVSLSLKPFATGIEDPGAEEAYRKAVLQLVDLRSRTVYDAEEAGLSLLMREAEWELVKEELSYEEKSYVVVKQRYEIGDATYDELQDASGSVSTARKDALTAERNVLSARKDVQLLLGPGVEEIEIASLGLVELLGMIEERKAEAGASGGEVSSLKLEQLAAELDRLRSDLAALWVWRPALSVSASVSVPFEDAQGSVSLSFSPSDLRNEERRELEETIEDKLYDISTERFSLGVELDLQERSVSVSEEIVESEGVVLEQGRLSMEEAELLYEQGELTELELEQELLRLKGTENRMFSSAADLYRSLGDLLYLYQQQ